jgi:hypothetical protein
MNVCKICKACVYGSYFNSPTRSLKSMIYCCRPDMKVDGHCKEIKGQLKSCDKH